MMIFKFHFCLVLLLFDFEHLFYLHLYSQQIQTCPNDLFIQHKKDKRKWKQLFNGKDLDDWIVKVRGKECNDNSDNYFTVDDHKLTVRYHPDSLFNEKFGHIFYNTPFSHYLLAVEYRFVGTQCKGGPDWGYRNSGIMIHCQSPQTMRKDQEFPVSIEVQLLGGDSTGERPTCNVCTPGTNVVLDGRLETKHCINSSSKTFRNEEWVRTEVLVLGSRVIKHIVNGDTVLTYTHPQLGSEQRTKSSSDGKLLSSGYISLQSESHPIEFRKVEIIDFSLGINNRHSNLSIFQKIH